MVKKPKFTDARNWIWDNLYGDEELTDEAQYGWDYLDYLINDEPLPDVNISAICAKLISDKLTELVRRERSLETDR